jgi:hypothetical protein
MSLLNPQELLHFLFRVRFSEFTALCKSIENTPKNEFLYEQTLAMNLTKILEKKTLREIQQFCLFNKLPIIDDKKMVDSIIAYCVYMTGSRFNINIKGCIQVDTYYMRNNDSEQIILLIGEYHDLDGNSHKIIDRIYKNTTCPIDIINEDTFFSYDSYLNEDTSYSHFSSYQGSNAIMMAHDSCVIHGLTPKDYRLDHKSQFFRRCIVPYQGRIKKFYEDYREAKFLHAYNAKFLDAKDFKGSPDEVYKKVLKVRSAVINFHTYLDDPEKYNTNVVDAIKKLNDILQTKQDIEEAMKIEKNHMDLMKGLIDNFDLSTLKKIIRVLQDNEDEELIYFMSYLCDLPMLLRVVKLLKENKSRYIVCFMGDRHRVMLQRYLSIPGLLDKILTSSSTLHPIETIPCEEGSCVLSLKKINCLQKTIRMQYYDSITKKKEPSDST